MKILVIRFTSMGDVVLTTPLFSFLKQRYPDASITFMTDPAYKELFEGDPRLSQVKTFVDGAVEESLRNERWDSVIDLQHNGKSRHVVDALTHAVKTGFFNKLYAERFNLLFMRVNNYPEKDSVPKRYIEAAGMPFDDQEISSPRLYFDITTRPNLRELLECGPMVRPSIALLPFSKWKNKQWPMDYFAKVGRFFHTKGWNVLVMGGEGDARAADNLRIRIGQRCRTLAGVLSLYECGCIFTQCSLALGVDTGLSHLARSCGVKTGIIYGPTTRHFGFYPYGEPSFKIFEQPFFCRPCHPHGGNICFLNRQCMRLSRPDMVIRGLQQLIHEVREEVRESRGFPDKKIVSLDRCVTGTNP